MDVALEIVFALAKIGLATAAAAMVTAVLLRRLLPAQLGDRLALPVSLTFGFCAGYWFLGEWISLVPERHRQWLPWLAILAALAGRNTALDKLRASRNAALSVGMFAALSLVSAWLLVPSWATLWPPRLVMVPLLAAYFVSLMASLAALPDRLLGRTFVGLLAAAASTVMLLIAVGVSVKIGSIAAAAAGGIGGCAAAALLTLTKSSEASRASASRSLVPIFAVLIGGLAFIGTIEPQKPLPIILLAPAAPLVLWLFAAGPLAKLQGWKSAVLQVAAVLLPLIVALAWLVIST